MRNEQNSYYIEKETDNLSKFHFDFEVITRNQAGITANLHSHPSAELIYIVKGKYNFSANGSNYIAEEGDMILFRSHVLHTISCERDQEMCYYVLKLHPNLIFDTLLGDENTYNSLFFLSSNREENCVFKYGGKYDRLWNDIALFSRSSDIVDRLKARNSVSLMILNILQNEGKGDNKLSEKNEIRRDNAKQIYDSILYIDAHFSEPITPVICAEQLGMSYSMYARCFKSVTGKSFKEYLTDIRMQKAEKMLITNNIPITDIAFMCGYSTSSHFIKEFRKRKDISPLKFRKQ